MPLTFHGARAGGLIVGVRTGDRRLAAADHAVLDLLAGRHASALHASALAEEAQASRERIVAAREEERRRRHRDPHDGLGPALTGAGFKADAAHNLVAAELGLEVVCGGALRRHGATLPLAVTVELGGTCVAGPTPTGRRVVAVLPLAVPS